MKVRKAGCDAQSNLLLCFLVLAGACSEDGSANPVTGSTAETAAGQEQAPPIGAEDPTSEDMDSVSTPEEANPGGPPDLPAPEEPAEGGASVAAATSSNEAPEQPDETPPEAVERCRRENGNTAGPEPGFHRCVVAALEGRDMRAREREVLIEGHLALEDEGRAIENMRVFVEQYPRDRRGNRYRILIRRHDRAD